MENLSVVVDGTSNLDAIRAQLRDVFELHFFTSDQIEDIDPETNVIFDLDIPNCGHIVEIKEWLAKRPTGPKIVFAVDKASWHAKAQASSFGASSIVNRPLDGNALMGILLGDFNFLSGKHSSPSLRISPIVAPALDALENVFLSAHLGAALDLKMMNFAGRKMIRSIAEKGVASWIKAVRHHHSRTYQHSLLVTGIIVAFAQTLRMSEADQLRLSLAAMLHDIGKARVPVSILEKPSALSSDEINVMHLHPEYGLEALAPVMGIEKDVLDMVVHHHEYLDGTGYPHGLRGEQLSDLARIVTISDIFGALTEQRSYKKPLSCKIAYNMLLNMGPRLDPDILREFSFVTKLHVD